MRKIREVLRLYFAAALSIRAIARSLGTSPSTVGEYLRRAKVAGVSWPVPEAIDDAGLERRLFPALPSSHTSRPLPDWSEVRRELRGKNVKLSDARRAEGQDLGDREPAEGTVPASSVSPRHASDGRLAPSRLCLGANQRCRSEEA